MLGTTTVIAGLAAPKAGARPIATTLDRKTSTLMAAGPRSRSMVMCGFPTRVQTGHPIAMVAGSMNLITAGRGFPMIRGAGRLITMDAGSSTAAVGSGGRVTSVPVTIRSGDRPTFPSSASATDIIVLDSDMATDIIRSAGARWGLATVSIAGGVMGATTRSTRLTSTTTMAGAAGVGGPGGQEPPAGRGVAAGGVGGPARRVRAPSPAAVTAILAAPPPGRRGRARPPGRSCPGMSRCPAAR